MIAGRQTLREAAAKAGFRDSEKAALALLSRAEIQAEIKKYKSESPTRQEVAEGLRRLAFGGIADVLRLLNAENLETLNLEALDLMNVAELKFSKNGGMEIKLFDRLKALERLSLLCDDPKEAGDAAFFDALRKGAAETELTS